MSENQQNDWMTEEDTLGDKLPGVPGKDLSEGTHVHRYIILGLIGKGGMGAVYKAYDPELDRNIALKMLTVSPQEGETASLPQARLMREAQALAKLNHPNVVFVFDVGTYEEGVYIAMEYVEGRTFRDWLKQDKPKPKEIIEVLLAAGRGLQAAHLEGIVHRDFKPENLIVGDNGQVKVLDFGLARAQGFENLTIDQSRPRSIIDSQSGSGEQLLSQSLTQVGSLIGTMAYMAPEHFRFQELDEKTDQFSYCITLFEALYGRRPFEGKTKAELEKNVTHGRMQIPVGNDVPDWIKNIALRGLSVAKNDRFPTMDQLLEELAVDPVALRQQRQKKQLMAGAIVAIALLPFLVWYLFVFESSLCSNAQEKLSGVWNIFTRGAVEKSFLKTEVAYAEDTLTRVLRLLDVYSSRWKQSYQEACEATHVSGEQSFDMLDLRMGCLRNCLREFSAMTEVFADADKTVVGRAVQAASAISDLSECSNLELLRAKTKITFMDEKTKQKSQVIKNRLIKVEAVRKSGQYKKALTSGKQILEEAHKTKQPQLIAAVNLMVGRALVDLGRLDEASAALENAYYDADGSGDDLKALRAANQLIYSVGYRQADHKTGQRWYRSAVTKRQRLRLDLNHPDVANSFHNLGNLHLSQGQYDNALTAFQQALSIRENVLFPNHPDLASSYNCLGIVYRNQGILDDAQQAYAKTLEIHIKALGPQHPKVGATHNNIGLLSYDQGKLKQSFQAYQQAIEIFRKSLGAEHPYLAISLYNIGELYIFQKKFDDALRVLQRARAILEKNKDSKLVIVMQYLGATYLRQGQYTKARDYYQESLENVENSLGKDHPIVVDSLVGMGEIAWLQGRQAESQKILERLIQICTQQTCDAESYCSALFILAQLLDAKNGDNSRALELGQQARTECKKMPLLKERSAKIAQWLQERQKT